MSWAAADAAAAEAIAARHAALDRPILVGLAGAQGSGKSTMAARLETTLGERGLRTAVLALDDFYLTRAERAALARDVHPLLATRGVPGTHDLGLLTAAIDALLAGRGATVPRFDKPTDDRAADDTLAGPFKVVLLEGWCIGARPQAPAALADTLNALERDEDASGLWRRWVNDRLATAYAYLFARIDLTIFLRAPSFSVVARWRGEQERGLAHPAMDAARIARFIQHFERITRAMLADPPADLVIDLDAERIPQTRA